MNLYHPVSQSDIQPAS